MLRKFRIKINEKEYMVEMEELGVTNQPTAPLAPSPQSNPPSVTPAPAPQPPVAPVQTDGPGTDIEAPMPGTIIKVLVKVGDIVKEEQGLVILEAMKMENELVAPKAGTVTAVHVTKGSVVDVGEALITIS